MLARAFANRFDGVVPSLLSVRGDGLGRRYVVGERCVIGRHHDCDVQLIDAELSKRHCEIRVEGGRAILVDLGSKNGVFVNGQRVVAEAPVARNDVILLGGQTLLYDPDLEALPTDDGLRSVLVVESPTQVTRLERRALESSGPLEPLLLAALRLFEGEVGGEGVARLMGALQKLVAHDEAVLLVGDESPEPLFVAARGSTLPVPRDLLAEVRTKYEALLIPDAAQWRLDGSRLVAHGSRSLLLAPLTIGVLRLGVVVLGRAGVGAFGGEDLARLVRAVPLLAIAVAQSRRVSTLQRRLAARRDVAPELIGASAPMQRLRNLVSKAAAAPTPVLVLGETGSGKELVARQLHAQGPRAGGPFVAVNCGALPEALVESELFGHEAGAFSGAATQKLGFFELAAGGTLLLDEVGELPLVAQVKLLRALQESTFYRVGGTKSVKVDVRLVAATHRDLEAKTRDGSFRADLFHRLAVIIFTVPALRERGDDVVELAHRLLVDLSASLGRLPVSLTEEAKAALLRYRWPGNVRELRNVLERAVVLGGGENLGVADLPSELAANRPGGGPAGSLPERVAELERGLIVEALAQAGGKKVEAARQLGISRPTLDRKIEVYAIQLRTEVS